MVSLLITELWDVIQHLVHVLFQGSPLLLRMQQVREAFGRFPAIIGGSPVRASNAFAAGEESSDPIPGSFIDWLPGGAQGPGLFARYWVA